MSNFIWCLLHPGYWLQVDHGKFCEYYDQSLNVLLDSGAEFNVLSQWTAQLGSYHLWIQNHPYASFTAKVETTLSNGLVVSQTLNCRRRTKARLRHALLLQEPCLRGII